MPSMIDTNYVAYESEIMVRLDALGRSREESIATLERVLLSGRSAILAGSAGLGKSHIASSIGVRLTADGQSVRRVRCTRWGSRQLDELRDHSHGAIIVDDAHLLDTDDLAALVELTFLPNVTVLATIDPDEVGRQRQTDERRRLITALWTDLGVERIDLSGVGYAEAVSVVESITGRAGIDTVSRARIIMQAAGNPLLLRELALDYRDDPRESMGAEQNGAWGAVTMSARLLDLADTRMHGLDDDDSYALMMLARLGTTSFARAIRLLGDKPVRRLLRRGLANRSPRAGDGVSVNPLFAHALLGGHHSDNPLDASGSVELLLLDEHRAGLSLSPAECALVAHYLTAHPAIDAASPSPRAAAQLFARAARHDREFGQTSSAALFAHRSLLLRPNALAVEQASRCLAAEGRVGEALELVRTHVIVDRNHAEDLGLLLWTTTLLTLREPGTDDLPHFEHQVRSWGTVTSELDDLILLLRARKQLVSSAYTEGAELLEAYAADPSKPGELMLRCLTELLEAYAYRGRMVDFTKTLRRGWAIVRERFAEASVEDERDRYGASTDFVTRAAVLRVFMGVDREGLSREIEAYAFRCLDGEDYPGLALVNLVAGQLALEQNAPARAEIELRRSLERQPKSAHPFWYSWAKVLHGCAQANLHLRTEPYANTGVASKAEAAARLSPILDSYAAHAHARDLIDTGLLEEARAFSRDRAAKATASSYLLAARSLHGAVALGLDPSSALAQLGDMERGDECELVLLLEQQLRATVSHDAAALELIADTMTRRGMPWEASVALQHAAEIHRSNGRQDAALWIERQATRARPTGAQNGSRDQDLSPEAPIDAETAAKIALLTKRELEVATLTGTGLSNSEIAKRLFISVRTVESHVWQARAKLGMSRRGDLGRLVARMTAQNELQHSSPDPARDMARPRG